MLTVERRKPYIETKTNDFNVIGDYSHGTGLPYSFLVLSASRVDLPVQHLSMLRGSWCLWLQATPGLHVAWVTQPWWAFGEAESKMWRCARICLHTTLLILENCTRSMASSYTDLETLSIVSRKP